MIGNLILIMNDSQLKDLMVIFANKSSKRGVFKLSKEEVERRKKNKMTMRERRKKVKKNSLLEKKKRIEEELSKFK